MKLTCLGGFGEQGRSALLIEGKSRFLVDYGVKKTIGEGFIGEAPLPISAVPDFVIVTHAHQDHVAMLPLLVERGIEVPIYATEATKDFSIDYCKSWYNNYDSYEMVPPYSLKSIEKLEKLFVTKPYFEEFDAGKGTLVTFLPSGHLIGSAIVYIKDEMTIAHFGDTNFNDPINPEPYLDFTAEVGVINGSYGDKVMQHEKLEEDFIEHVMAGKNDILIPAAALGRGQEVCLLLLKYIKEINKKIYISKSIIENAKQILKFPNYIKSTAVQELNAFVNSPYFHILEENRIEELVKEGVIFIAPDAMLSSGLALKIFNIIKDDPTNVVVLSGYLAPGTLGRKINEHKISVNAKVYMCELKAHTDLADNELIIRKNLSSAKLILIHHGEEPKSSELAERLKSEFALDIRVPKIGEEIIL